MGGHRLINATAIVTAMAFISKITGFLREVVFAAFYGVSQVMDAFLIALVIPDLLGTVLRTGIVTAFIPVYSSYLTLEKQKTTQILANTILVIIAGLLIILVIVGLIFAPMLISFLAPGFSLDVQAITVNLTRLLLPILIVSGIVGVVVGIQQAHGIFLYPALIYIVLNVSSISMVVLFSAQIGIYAAVLAFIIGVLVQLGIQWPGLQKCHHRFSPVFNFSHDGVKKMGWLIIPVLLGMAANNANLLVDRILASSLPTGNISALNYASKINAVFIGIVATPITTVMFPTLTQHIASGNIEAFKNHLNICIRIIAFIIIPIMSVFIVFSVPIVEVLLKRGAFDSQAVQSTAFALMFFAFGMLGMALIDLANQAFYAQQNTKIPVMVNIGIVLVNIGLNFILIRTLAQGGLALATSISISLGVLTLFYILKLRMGAIGGMRIMKSFSKIVVASSIMIIIGYMSFEMLKEATISHDIYGVWGTLLPLCITLSICGLTYIVVSFLLKCDEFILIIKIVAEQFPRLMNWTKLDSEVKTAPHSVEYKQ